MPRVHDVPRWRLQDQVLRSPYRRDQTRLSVRYHSLEKVLRILMAAADPDWRQPSRHRVGIFRFVNRRHPRVLARIRPAQLGLRSFVVAIAHGAGLMLVPNLSRSLPGSRSSLTSETGIRKQHRSARETAPEGAVLCCRQTRYFRGARSS
jgi:hypothetical protein